VPRNIIEDEERRDASEVVPGVLEALDQVLEPLRERHEQELVPTARQHHRQPPQQAPPALTVRHQSQAAEVDLRVQARRRVIEPHRDAPLIRKPQCATAKRCRLLYGTRTPSRASSCCTFASRNPRFSLGDGVNHARIRSRCGTSSSSLSPGARSRATLLARATAPASSSVTTIPGRHPSRSARFTYRPIVLRA
jgi:hypothetical protein